MNIYFYSKYCINKNQTNFNIKLGFDDLKFYNKNMKIKKGQRGRLNAPSGGSYAFSTHRFRLINQSFMGTQ
ncbi:MAG: hypothetical protein CMA97_02485 [Euryarchaeota archaeon]|nr:hypothetical protein [Euryarchaeota archaeon]